jgi:hypothetical protein
MLLTACADLGSLKYLTLLLEVGGTLVVDLLVGLLLLQNRLGDGDVVLGGDGGAGHFAGG